VGHHRFIATVDLTIAKPDPGSEKATLADQVLIDTITAAMVGNVTVTYNGVDYTVEALKKAKPPKP
jgi:hypothetical protein